MIPLHQIFRALIVTTIILACICIPVSAAEHVVAPQGAEFSSIQDAVDWSSSGDTVRVQSGTYVESIHLEKKIALVGVDSGNGVPVIEPGNKGDGISILAEGCSVEGFTIQNSEMWSAIRIASDSNTIRNNILRNNGQGISLVSARKNTISANEIAQNNKYGISLESSSENRIEQNTFQKNTIGITLDGKSLGNLIIRNNFLNNQNVLSESPTSTWSSLVPYSYTYLGQKAESRMGNYWKDYQGRDKNGDGIGDNPYVVSVGITGKGTAGSSQEILDEFPLMDPREYYTAVTPAGSSPGLKPTVVSQAPTTPVVTAPPPTRTIQVTDNPPSGAPFTFPRIWPNVPVITLVLSLLLVMLIIAAGVMYFRRDKPEPAGEAGITPVVARAASILKTAINRIPSSATTPATNTIQMENTQTSPHPAIADQKNYFPRELENKYTEIMFVGRGGIAWVFSAIRKTDGIRVAVKIPISFDEVTGKCFLNEIAAWETLRHPNIVEVTAVNILPVPYVEMEFVPSSLEAIEKPLPVWKAVHLITGIVDGLRYAHEHGFIHRDIKPHNILLTEALVPKITDWGMSKVLAAEVKKSSIAGFSLSYAAPEQVSPTEFGRTDERTDIYQLGVVFYELVTGSIPFGGESIVEVGNAILRETPIPPSEYNPDAEAVEKIILKCLAKNPPDRYQSAAELMAALRGYLDEDDD
ncbi:protein kinase [uncultured Methanoregula sp.]|uniref:protein kinase domain-containing protein n=1 Tax=uncultured Methanoregula sp. TaxID=1005933 RepID=UPI002AAA7D10|nr:protein kinase [uncultured Methanoregula sp.]